MTAVTYPINDVLPPQEATDVPPPPAVTYANEDMPLSAASEPQPTAGAELSTTPPPLVAATTLQPVNGETDEVPWSGSGDDNQDFNDEQDEFDVEDAVLTPPPAVGSSAPALEDEIVNDELPTVADEEDMEGVVNENPLVSTTASGDLDDIVLASQPPATTEPYIEEGINEQVPSTTEEWAEDFYLDGEPTKHSTSSLMGGTPAIMAITGVALLAVVCAVVVVIRRFGQRCVSGSGLAPFPPFCFFFLLPSLSFIASPVIDINRQ